MTIGKKILYTLLTLLGVSLVAFLVYQQILLRRQAQDIQNSVIEMKQLKDDIIRGQSQYVDKKGFEDFVNDNHLNMNAIEKDISSLGGKIDAVNVAIATSQGQVVKGGGSTTVTPINNSQAKNCTGTNCVTDPFNYWGTQQSLILNENFGKITVPFGTISFFAGSQDNKPWSYTISTRQYQVANTIAHAANGQTVVYNALQITSDGKSYEVPLASSKTVEVYPARSFSWWNPKLSLGVGGTALVASGAIKGEVTPQLSISLMSYGQTKLTPDVRFIDVGIGYNTMDRAAALTLSPVQFNVGRTLTGGKIINNLWLGPTLGFDTKGSASAGATLEVNF